MSEGFEIPLEGDATPFHEAVSQLKHSMRQMMRTAQRGTAGGRRDVARLGGAWRAMGVSAKLATTAGKAGLRGVATAAALARRSVGSVFGKIKGMMMMGPLGGGLLGGAGLAAGAFGIKKAFDVGGELSDLSSRTGIAVKDLEILRQAFEDNGASAEQVGPLINKMQRGLSDARAGLATQTRALERMGLAVDDLLGLSPADQFEVIQKRIAAMGDPMDRTATAMELFGRTGAEMLAMFDDPDALAKARVTIGSQAEVLDRNAARFDRISDLLKSAGKKLRGFFVGVAEQVAPVVLKLLEAWNKFDFTAVGKRIGRVLLAVVAAVKDGRIVEFLSTGFRLAAAAGIDVLMRGLRAGVAFLATALPPVFDTFFSKLKDPGFWDGLATIFRGMAKMIQAELLAALPKHKERADFERDVANTYLETGKYKIMLAGDQKALGDVLATSLAEGLVAAGKAAGGPAGMGLQRASEDFRALLRSLEGTVEVLADEIKEPSAPKRGALPFELGEEEAGGAGAVRGGAATIAQSMARFGGGGRGFTLMAPALAEAKKGNKLLGMIEKNTRPGTGGPVASYA